MNYYSLNMAVLRQRNPILAEELENAGDAGGEFSVEEAASGAPTLAVRAGDASFAVHSRRDPEREAERLVGSIPGGGEAPVIVLGFGLGYAASAVAAKFPERPVIAVEKRPGVLKKAAEARDLSALFSRKGLVFVLGGSGEGVTGALSLFGDGGGEAPEIIRNRALCGMDGEWYDAVEERIREWNTRSGVNQATLRRFGKRWVRNLARNLEAVRDVPGISRLGGLLRGKGIPVFLAAAGPTLDGAAPFLGEIQERCLVVCVDTSLRFLLSRGIEPDFAVSVDPQYWNFRHLDRVVSPKTRLIAESAVYPPCLRHSFGGIFLAGSFFPPGRFIERAVDPKGDLGAGGSVATSAWDFVRLLGADEVWIAGLDLSFPELKTHFRGALFEENAHAESRRFSPVETWNVRALRDGNPFRMKRQGGGTVLTDRRLSLYAHWFENRFRLFGYVKNFCLSGEGLAISGIETSAAGKLISLPRRRKEIDLLLGEAYAAAEKDFGGEEASARRAEKYENARKLMLGGLEEIKALAEDAALSAERAAAGNRRGGRKDARERILKKLDAADKAIAESAVKEIAGFLFPETGNWEAEIAPEEKDPLARHLEFSARFYRALADAADYHLRVFNAARSADTEVNFHQSLSGM